jgi:putative transposase
MPGLHDPETKRRDRFMILTEEHRISRSRNKDLFSRMDSFCYLAKNLSNSVNYLLKQCYRIHRKLKEGEVPDSWEKGMIYRANCAIYRYNQQNPGRKPLRYIDENSSLPADPYFLSWYMKTWDVYRAMPYATCSQVCIQERCRDWKAFFKSLKKYRKDPRGFSGRPKAPGYLDPVRGRGRIVITSQNFSVDQKGNVCLPDFLSGIRIRAEHPNIRQIRIQTDSEGIRVQLMYKKEEAVIPDRPHMMGIDMGVDNLMAVSFDSEKEPVLVNGRPLKSINQFYNKRKAFLQRTAIRSNQRCRTKAMDSLTRRRNRKVRDYMHKASRKIIELAEQENVGTIVIGRNAGWKQNVEMGKRTNQNFVSIPYHILIEMIQYKAALAGITVNIIGERYTSGTSYIDREYPDKKHYNKSRRIERGLFRSNTGICINADVNAAYQIMKAGGAADLPVKVREKVLRINAA